MKPGRVGYLIPEFPGQTHIWIWRELVWMRRWGTDVRLISTRPPPDRDRARHAFAAAAAGETTYLHRPGPSRVAGLAATLARRSLTGPLGTARAVARVLSLPVEGGAARRGLPLLAPAARLAEVCAREGIGHVHCHTCGNGAVIAMLAEAMGGAPYSLTINANLDWWGGAMAEKLGGAAFTVSTMRWVKADVDARFPAAVAARCHYAPVGVDTDDWQPVPRPPRTPGAPLRLVCVGRMHPSKGFDVALHALRAVVDHGGVDVHLALLGDGPERAALETQAGDLGLRERVRFAGSVPEEDVRQALEGADIFLLPSHAEPLGVVVMEAMATGTPVIATAAGGVTEIVTDGVDGLTVRPGDPAALAAAILALASDDARRAALAAAGRRSVVERFDARVGARTLFALVNGRAPEEA